MKLQHSVIQKKLKLQKQKLEMKTDLILQSQVSAIFFTNAYYNFYIVICCS